MQPCVAEHRVVESRPDSEVHDLRLDAPWPELERAARGVELDELGDAEHSHVPYGEPREVFWGRAWRLGAGGDACLPPYVSTLLACCWCR
jgi:amyloid beta precursor protein binding protein 1